MEEAAQAQAPRKSAKKTWAIIVLVVGALIGFGVYASTDDDAARMLSTVTEYTNVLYAIAVVVSVASWAFSKLFRRR